MSKVSSVAGGLLNWQIAVPLVIGLISIIAFIRRQFILEEPILDFRVLHYHNFRKGMIIL